ncbi:acyltransferase family protein [Terriglobus aquaticus]|uniref:Acyltransferase family protein n=1 Tax=Terriglobus aquaticus TaxID=940139 RepID=A0ABW9KMX7_9BACT|nr:acyltransferase [Terriglobus aquaticus]
MQPVTAGEPAARSELIDAARGLAIILVVIGHTSQGMTSRGLWQGSSLDVRIYEWMYSFHMPAFFFLAGLFATGSLRKRGLPRFLRDRVSTLLWPYFLFELLNLVIFRVGAHVTHKLQPAWTAVAWTFFTAAGAWFLPTLFFALAVFAIVISLPVSVPMILLLAISLVVRKYCLAIPINFVAAGLFFLPMVILGAIVGGRVQQVVRIPRVISSVLAASIAWLIWHGTARHWEWNYFGSLLLALAGTGMLLLAARVVDGTDGGHWLAWCGQASIGIFLLAPYAQVAVRTLLLHVHLTGKTVQLLLPSLAAVLFGGWVYHHRDDLHARFLFVFPRWSLSR